MSERHEWFPFHRDQNVAGAVGALLAGAPTVDDVVTRFDVAREDVLAVIHDLGIEAEIAASLPQPDTDTRGRDPPPFLADRPPVKRPQTGIRDPTTKAIVGDTYDLPFVRALWSDASRRAHEAIEQDVETTFGSDAAGIMVTVEARPTTREFPDHVRWIGVHYPVGESRTVPPANVERPTVSFEYLAAALPSTIDVTVELEGERFVVRNIPVTVSKEQRV